ncbi:TonB-dependent siderophore receptor [Acinetobacter sp. 194]|uniref:TonB-dependent siderophore receptor n=1 Tax=Acinetobacter shaoyimingii TaxID=2715164 RepID=UPI0014084BDF|nr:TonB-dependent siderophore receptor [Acinetobacter shaoyimingii]NHB58854.1 TonB-dependent siderophore receptor [Acinetobacter shaoyimingii]
MKTPKLKKNSLSISLHMILVCPVVSTVVYADEEVKALETIVLTSNDQQSSYPTQISMSGFASHDVSKIPASISVVTEETMAQQHARVLSDVIKNDASLGDSYAAIGYYPNFVSRGFGLDLGSSYLINGNVVRGEQNVALENKERVEILKGISAIQSGMSTPGGVVNYVTKRPEQIKAITLTADQYGQYSLATDVGGFFGRDQQFGYRVNLAGERLDSYVEHIKGKRFFGSLALDWKLSDQSKLEFDFEAQRQQQRSVPGYQLLNGTQVPQHVKWERLLGYPTWGKPVTMESFNTSLKYTYALNDQWTFGVGASHSQSKIDDYSNFAWGCYDDTCQYTGLGNSFDQNGNYDIYDYQNPDDTFKTSQFKMNLDGQLDTTSAVHHLNIELAQLYKTRDRYGSVNLPIGVGNIYHDNPTYEPKSGQIGQRYQALKSNQTALTFLDRIEWNDQWSTLLGGKWIHLDEEAHNKKREKVRQTDLDRFLPQFAVMYQPVDATTLYASYAKGLADGRSAAWFAENADEILSPIHSEQYEIGLKQKIKDFLFTAAIFDLRQDNQYTKPDEAGKFYFVSEGKQRSLGLELGLQGHLTERLEMNSSLALTRARLQGISLDAYKDHQAQNIPKVRLATQLIYSVPTFSGFNLEGLKLIAGAQYSASKFANKEATAKVKDFTVFDVGAAYPFQINNSDALLRLSVNNVFNQKYWRDVGEFDGDNYMFLGNPRTATLSLNMKF